ncbi:MAG: Spo0B domain-containing protein [Thermoanaerobacteraceae bacterium]|nr:Spo0B domain-containing protein [Thermoanaerobacteraceae bacterium]
MNSFPSTYFLVAIYLGQVLALSLGTLTLQYNQILESRVVLFLSVFIILNYLIAILFFQRLFQADYQSQILEIREKALDKAENMLQLVRAQRHDIINHLHTIYALLQMGRDKQARKYVSELEIITANANQTVRLDEPIVAAFLQSKLMQARAKDLFFNIEVLTELAGCAAKPYFIITILGYLLDNAFEAVENLPVGTAGRATNISTG